MERGHTLIELTVALLLAAGLMGSLVPAARSYRHRFAVVSARESLAGLFAEARMVAPAVGGATVHLTSEPGRAWVAVDDSVGASVALEEEFGVRVQLGFSRTTAQLSYDALGLGRVASLTVRLRRGDAQAGLTVSSFGRVRRW